MIFKNILEEYIMRIEKGTTRIVIILGNLAIKIAKIQPIEAFRIALIWKGVQFWKQLIKNYRYPLTMQHFLMIGIVNNWQEFTFYRKHYSKFLVPTYFSLLGLINVQKAEKKLKIEIENLKCQLLDLTDQGIYDNPHHFCQPENFTKTNEHLQMLDYGDSRSHKVLKKYGDKIYNEFNFSHTRKS